MFTFSLRLFTMEEFENVNPWWTGSLMINLVRLLTASDCRYSSHITCKDF